MSGRENLLVLGVIPLIVTHDSVVRPVAMAIAPGALARRWPLVAHRLVDSIRPRDATRSSCLGKRAVGPVLPTHPT